MNKITVELYTWSGTFFPFKIKTSCGECSLNRKVIQSVIDELPFEVEFKEKPWLNNWYKLLLKGGHHAPIVLVNNKVIEQEEVITREKLKEALLKEYVKTYQVSNGIVIFTLPSCKFCKAAKELLNEKHYKFQELEVISDSLNMAKMMKVVKGRVHPITMPQIFIDKNYIGGYDELEKHFQL